MTDRARARGRVESYHPKVGIIGWAVRSEQNGASAAEVEPAEVELVAGNTVLAAVRTRVLRPELRSALPSHATGEPWIGFRFTPPALALAASLSLEDRARRLRVRHACTGDLLPGPALPTGDELATISADVDDTSPPSSTVLPDEPASAGELIQVLEALRLDASALTISPMAFPTNAHRGSIEVVVKIGRGLSIIGGWTTGAVPRQSSAIVLHDGRKIAASVFSSSYERADLPADAVAFSAILRTDANLWRNDQDFILTFGEAERLMRSRRPSLFLEVGPGLAWLTNATKISAADKELFSQAARMNGGAPVAPEAVGCQVALDRVTLYPGFGALVRGWVLSPRGDLTSVSLLQDGSRADATRDRIATTPRPDLASGFPLLADRTGRSGFTAMCIGPLADNAERPTVLIGLDDGTELTVTTSSQIVRSGYSPGTLMELADSFPSYVDEGFFPLFCGAYAETAAKRRPKLQYIRRRAGSRTLLFHLPLPAADARLAMSDLKRGVHDWDDPSVTLLLGPDHDRAAITRAVTDMLPHHPLAIVQHDGRAMLAHSVREYLADNGIERFVFVQVGSRLTWTGWDAAVQFLRAAKEGVPMVFLHDVARNSVPAQLREVGAVCWDALSYRRYAERAAPTLNAATLGTDLSLVNGLEPVENMVSRYHGPRALAHAARISADIERMLWQSKSR